MPPPTLTRRSLLAGAGATVALALAGCTTERTARSPSPATSASSRAAPVVEPTACGTSSRSTLWGSAIANGVVFGSSAATWQIEDREYRRLYERESAILFTE